MISWHGKLELGTSPSEDSEHRGSFYIASTYKNFVCQAVDQHTSDPSSN